MTKREGEYRHNDCGCIAEMSCGMVICRNKACERDDNGLMVCPFDFISEIGDGADHKWNFREFPTSEEA